MSKNHQNGQTSLSKKIHFSPKCPQKILLEKSRSLQFWYKIKISLTKRFWKKISFRRDKTPTRVMAFQLISKTARTANPIQRRKPKHP
jgi:hypothetical protein